MIPTNCYLKSNDRNEQVQYINRGMKTQYYKILAISSFAIFLFTVLKVQSIVFLCLSGIFGYIFMLKTLNSLTQRDLIQLLPKKIKKHVQEQSLGEYISNLQIVKSTPMLNYFVPLLNSKPKQKSQLQYSSKTQTTSAITNQQLIETEVKSAMIKFIRHDQEIQRKFASQLIGEKQDNQKVQLLLANDDKKNKMLKEETGNLTTCESAYNSSNALQHKGKTGMMTRNPSMVIKKKFAEESSSNDEKAPFSMKTSLQKRIHRSNSQNKLSLSRPNELDHKQTSNRGSVQPSHHNPLRTIQEYIQALIWMMKRLLGLRKMTSKIKRASTVKLTIIASFFWIVIVLQIKIDSKKGKLFFRTLRALLGVLSVFAALGATAVLIYKIHRKITGQDQKRPQRFSLFGKRQDTKPQPEQLKIMNKQSNLHLK